MALAVPLSRFTSRVGGGSAFLVRPSGCISREVPLLPLELTQDEARVGFRLMNLDLHTYFTFLDDRVRVAARQLSDTDIMLKMRVTRWTRKTSKNEVVVTYRHLRYGRASWREQIRRFWRDLRFGVWRSWFRGFWPWRVGWQDIPCGRHESPLDDCSDGISWSGVIGIAFHEDSV